MREELNRSLRIGDVSVAEAIQQVEEELARWGCGSYSHITRAISIAQSKIINLETIFSQPTQCKPVPTAVVYVYFHLDVSTGILTYQFEQENVQHHVGGMSLAPGQFQNWLDRIIGDKLQVRQLHNLATPFEETRLPPPPAVVSNEVPDVDEQEEDGGEEEQGDTGPQIVDASGTKETPEKMELSTLLANIFDAADEEDEYELTHKEVSDLLYATPLGLADWDIKLLLTTATELETGKIEYKPFVQAAPEIVEGLVRRRTAFEERTKDHVQVPPDYIELCYGEEIEEVARAARDAFASVDTVGQGTLSRHDFRSCLLSRGERFSVQDVQMLMQMCEEDDFGQVPYDDIQSLLHQLRLDALHNALIETNVQSLLVHLLTLCRREGLAAADNIMQIWDLRNVLLSADQLCLSRTQMHVILSIVHPDERGNVDAEYFLRVCCTVIPHMFDRNAFAETAAMIAKDKADAQAKQEEEELKGLSATALAKRRPEDEDLEEEKANAPDRDTVEKTLIHLGNQEKALEVRRFLDIMRSEQVQQCQFSEAELRGFIAEAEMDERGKVLYFDLIKTWIPIIFELRRSKIYDEILIKDWGMQAEDLIDLPDINGKHWLRGFEDAAGSRPSSASSRHSTSRRGNRPRGNADDGRTGTARKGHKGTKGSRPLSGGGSQRSLPRTNSSSSAGSASTGKRESRPASRVR